MPVRLQVYLARSNIGSRRACERYIEEGRVQLNHRVVDSKGVLVREGDEVCFDGRPVWPTTRLLYLGLHKPERYICANSDPVGRPLAIDLMQHHFSERLFTIGRLDFLSSGLVLVTNDGRFAQRVAHPSHSIEKEYIVSTLRPIREEWLRRFRHGIRLEGIFYRLKRYRLYTPRRVHLVLIDGKNRAIRRVFDAWSCTITRLHRVRIGPVRLPNSVRAGHYFHLPYQDIHWFNNRDSSD